MKKNILLKCLSITTLLLAIVQIGSTQPKSSQRDFVYGGTMSPIPSYAAGISSKAVKDFHSRFAKINTESWYNNDGGIVSYFVNEGVTCRVMYDKNGNWKGTEQTYSEEGLPDHLRSAVKGTYFDYNITLVNEIQTMEGLVYIIHLENKSSLKNIRVNSDGEMDVRESYQKG
jgi:YD repeat-containing protein